MVEENHLAPTPANCTDPHSLRRTRFTLVLRKAIFPPAMVLGTYTAKSTTLRGKHSNKLYLPVYHIQIPWPMPLIVMLLKTVKKYNIPQAPQQQQNFPPQHYNVQSFTPSHFAAVGPIPSVPLQNDCAVGKAPAVEVQKELVS